MQEKNEKFFLFLLFNVKLQLLLHVCRIKSIAKAFLHSLQAFPEEGFSQVLHLFRL